MTDSVIGDSENESPSAYSRAFENFVQDADDVVGLLAYARYKQTIRDDCVRGNRTEGHARDPAPTTVEVFRGAAQRNLEEFASSAIEEARLEIQQSAVLNAVIEAETTISNLVQSRTSFRSAITTNVVAWLITLGISALILIVYALPNWQQNLIKALSDAAKPASQSSTPNNQ